MRMDGVCPVMLAVAGFYAGGGLLLAQTETGGPAVDTEYRKLEELLVMLRTRNAAQYAIRGKDGIDEARYVPIGGIEQWITIRGQDRANPVLLFLHGGPGDVTNPWTYGIFAAWEEHFTLVQWDQRGAGRTLRKTGPAVGPTMTLDRMAQDGVELAEHLRTRLGKEKIVVVAHSFGSILGLRMVAARPDLFSAYVGTGQVGDSMRNYAVAYDALLKKAQALANREALDDLRRVGQPPYKSGEGYGVQRKWANRFEGADQFLMSTLGFALTAPGRSARDINDSGDGQMLSGERLVPQTRLLGPKELGQRFSVPIFVIQGAEDFTTPTTLAREYLKSIQAPRKEFVTLAGAGHFAVFMHSGQFMEVLLKRVRPLAK